MNVGVKNPLHATGFLSRVGSSLFAAPATGEPPKVKDVNGPRLDIPANEFLAGAKRLIPRASWSGTKRKFTCGAARCRTAGPSSLTGSPQ